MCLVVVALSAHPVYDLVLAANRDEYHARPAAPASWGRDETFRDILAGRDLLAGGTWLGVRRDGRFALVTNVRDGKGQDPTARSRGELVTQALNGTTIAGEKARYNGFNLLTGDASRVRWMSNRSEATREVTRGIYGLSNALLDVPWPKVVRTQERFAAWASRGETDTAALFAALADQVPAPDVELPSTGVTVEWERVLSSPFIVTERYGTRCSTVFTVDRSGSARFHERTFAPDGSTAGEVVEEFALG